MDDVFQCSDSSKLPTLGFYLRTAFRSLCASLVWVCLLISSAMSCIGSSYFLRLIILGTELRFGLAAPGPDSFISFKPLIYLCVKMRCERYPSAPKRTNLWPSLIATSQPSTWLTVRHARQAIMFARGTLPGDPHANVVLRLVILRVLHTTEVARARIDASVSLPI